MTNDMLNICYGEAIEKSMDIDLASLNNFGKLFFLEVRKWNLEVRSLQNSS